MTKTSSQRGETRGRMPEGGGKLRRSDMFVVPGAKKFISPVGAAYSRPSYETIRNSRKSPVFDLGKSGLFRTPFPPGPKAFGVGRSSGIKPIKLFQAVSRKKRIVYFFGRREVEGCKLTPGRQINAKANQKLAEADQKMKSSLDLGCCEGTVFRPETFDLEATHGPENFNLL